MNPWSAKTLVISHVAQFESCEDGMDFNFDSAEDLTPGPYDLEISPNTMEGTSFQSSSNLLGDSTNFIFAFLPSQTFYNLPEGQIRITVPSLSEDE